MPYRKIPFKDGFLEDILKENSLYDKYEIIKPNPFYLNDEDSWNILVLNPINKECINYFQKMKLFDKLISKTDNIVKLGKKILEEDKKQYNTAKYLKHRIKVYNESIEKEKKWNKLLG
jgi:hypothetical protein